MSIKFSKNTYLSNFYPCNVEFDGVVYKSSEAAWQAQKTLDLEQRKKFCNCSASEAKKLGRHVKLRSDWEDIKYKLMVDVCYAKFSQNKELEDKLKSTGTELLIENTTGWHDNVWGNCECSKCTNKIGKNLLGKALMLVRFKLSSK